MPLRRKTSGRKNSNSSDIIPNGLIGALKKESPAVIQECDVLCYPASQEKQRFSTRSASVISADEDKVKEGRGRRESTGSTSLKSTPKEGKGRRESTGSIPSKSIAKVRRASRDCVIPEDIVLSGQQKFSDHPKVSINDCDHVEGRQRSRPITLQRIRDEEKECISIRELSESPHRYGIKFAPKSETLKSDVVGSRLSVSSAHDSDGEHTPFLPPSSPLLVAMRTAVHSLSQYEDFEILDEIGSGFFAQVFKVRHKPTKQLMVLKKNKKKASSLVKEIELLKQMLHPNILHYVGACIHEGQIHPLTEYVNGGALEQLIQGPKEFPWSLRVHLSLDISKGMSYLHTHGMLHRDLNSKNVLLRMHGSKYTAVVADFGLAAKTIPSFKKLTRSQSIVGTPYWMAPEVLTGKPYNETADVFSYGIVLCEIITRLSADPDDIPRSKDYALDVQEFKKLPQVTSSSCPQEFMELAFLSCRFLPIERPCFSDITTRLHVILDLHDLDGPNHREGLEDTDTTLTPQPALRLSQHLHSGSMSPASLIQSLDFIDSPHPPQPRETSV